MSLSGFKNGSQKGPDGRLYGVGSGAGGTSSIDTAATAAKLMAGAPNKACLSCEVKVRQGLRFLGGSMSSEWEGRGCVRLAFRARVRIPVRVRARRARTSFPAAAVAPRFPARKAPTQLRLQARRREPAFRGRRRRLFGEVSSASSGSGTGSARQNQLFAAAAGERLLSECLLRALLRFRGDGGGLFFLGTRGLLRWRQFSRLWIGIWQEATRLVGLIRHGGQRRR